MAVSTSRVVYNDLLVDLRSAVSWLNAQGVGLSATRFGRYQDTLIDLDAARIRGDDLHEVACRLTAFASLFEANELIHIHKGLSGRGLDSFLLPRLKKLASGPESYVAEKPASSSNQARDAGFELAVIASLASAGLRISQQPGLADVTAELGGQLFVVECKRPQSERALAKMIREAGFQLAKRYRTQNTRVVGIIALDLTKVSNPDLAVTVDASADQVISAVNAYMETVVKKNAANWNRVSEPQTAAVLLRCTRLAWIREARAMAWIHKTGITPFTRRRAALLAQVNAIRGAIDESVLAGVGQYTEGHHPLATTLIR